MVQAHHQGNHHGDDRLDIGIHADHDGLQAFLREGNQEIGDEGGAHHHIDDLPHHIHRHGGQVGCLERTEGEGERHQRGEEEHPLHERDHGVLLDQRLEDPHVGRETQGVDHHTQNAPDGRRVGPGADGNAVEDQDQHADQAQDNTRHTAPRNPLVDDDGRNDERHDRAQRAHDGRIDGRTLRDSEEEGQLRHEQPQKGRDGYLPQIRLRNLLPGRREQRPDPEQRRCSKGTQAEERHRRDIPVDGDVLAADDIESENGVCRKARQVSDQSTVFHDDGISRVFFFFLFGQGFPLPLLCLGHFPERQLPQQP